MKRTACLPLLFALHIVSFSAWSEEDAAKQLQAIEASLKKTPDDPMLHYRKAQFLMKLEKREEGFKTAQAAMQLFIKAKNDLAWMMLENITIEGGHIDVHFNMGPRERKAPDIGIVKPLSFRVWSKDGGIIGIYDFEIGMFEGKPSTAAMGQTTDKQHANFGILKTDATYEEIRAKALDVILKNIPKK